MYFKLRSKLFFVMILCSLLLISVIDVRLNKYKGVKNSFYPKNSTFLQRAKNIEYECKQLEKSGKLRSSYIEPVNFVTVRKYNLTWCPIYKAGSSNWMKNFSILGGLNVTR